MFLKIHSDMKKAYKSILLLTLAIALAGIYSSCKKSESLPNNGQPVIKYVRSTNPTISDSLLVAASQGNLIAIMGENLGGAVEVWFNDQKALLTPTYVTNTTIMVSVPNPIPTVITNKLKIVFANGQTLLYDFKVTISKPVITSMNCEYVATGDVALIRGDFFYPPLTVTFAGGAVGTLVSLDSKNIMVTVPAGAQPGQITVHTNFGDTKTNFWFRDNRNIVVSSDPYTGWWNASFVVTSPGPADPPLINGNYIRVKQFIGGWGWLEVCGGPSSAMGAISKNIPDEAILKPELYNLKFEVNTMKPYNGNNLVLNFGLLDASNGNNNAYSWKPPFDTQGKWQTVVIAFDDMVKAYGAPLVLSSTGYYCRVLFFGPGDLNCDMSFDNFRIVPKVIK